MKQNFHAFEGSAAAFPPPIARSRDTPTPPPEAGSVTVPNYLRDVYTWAYIDPVNVRLLDQDWVVNTVLWGNDRRLQQAAFEELQQGQRVLQACCVYGDLSQRLARYLGPRGELDIIDVAPIQVAGCRQKIADIPQAKVRHADAAEPGNGTYDAIVSFFLLHEMPDGYKHRVVDALLSRMAPGGKVVFIDYHQPHWAHPLRPIMSVVFDLLEPFAKSLCRHRIAEFASRPENYTWRTETYFGGLYQKTVASRR